MLDFLKLAAANFVGSLAAFVVAEVIAVRWLKKHKPHIEKNNDITV